MFGEIFHFTGHAEQVPIDYEELAVSGMVVALNPAKVAACSLVVCLFSGGPARIMFTAGLTSAFGWPLFDMEQMTLSKRTAGQLQLIKSNLAGATDGVLRAIYCLWVP